MAAYAIQYGSVTQYQGLEISLLLPHVGWFGGQPTLADYTGVTKRNYSDFLRQQVATIHAAGGVASYNHPLGYNAGPWLSSAAQDTKVSQMASQLLGNSLLGCDLLEVGYPLRGSCDLAHHLKLWDILSRYARFITGNGVTDDHFGQNWTGIKNNWYTSVWAATKTEADLVAALRAGRPWSASPSRFRGTLDLVADGVCPMGSASVSQVTRRQLLVVATGVPAGGTVQVIRGVVDYTGNTSTAGTIATYTASALASGSVTLAVDTSVSCFVRTQVLDSRALTVAASNPLWLLRESPPGGIPAPRAA